MTAGTIAAGPAKTAPAATTRASMTTAAAASFTALALGSSVRSPVAVCMTSGLLECGAEPGELTRSGSAALVQCGIEVLV
jgi:hypothetical protein